MAGTKVMKMSTVYYRRKVINAKNISWDVSNVTMMYNSSLAGKVNTNPYSNRPKSYLTIMDGDSDLSSSAPVILKAVGVKAFWYRGTSSGTIGSSTGVTGTGNIRVEISAMTADSGTITATSVAAPGLSATIDCVRVTNRYTFELVCNPTQITYNMTTGVKSAESFAINLYVNKSNGGREKATFAAYGALNWRYVGTTTWTNYSNQGTSEATITPDFSKNGIEVQFVDANGVVGDTKTLSILKVSNGGDSYAVISGSTSISLMLESLDHGAPIGDVINTIALTKNGVALTSGVEYIVPASSDGDKSTVDDSFPTASNYEYYGWIFNYSLSGGRLKSTLVKVLEGSPTSVQVPIDIYYKDGGVEIWRQALISYSVIMKGPAGRSYKPNVAVIWNERDTYVWDDAQRDFVYYPFTDDNDETNYYLYGVKTYNPNGGLKNVRPSKKGGDDYWELVSEASTLITNCIFGTNAIMGGFTFTKEMMTSRSLDKNGESDIIIDGNSGTFKGNNFVGKNCNISGVINATSGSFTGKITATSGTFDNCTINETCEIKGKLVGAYGQFGAWEIAAYGGYDLICRQSVDVLFEMINTKHNTRSIVLRTTNGNSTSQGDGSTDSVPMVRVVTDNGVGGEFTANNSGGYALKAYGYNGATALYVGGLSKFSGNVSMSLSTTIPTITGYLYRDSNGFVKIKI